MRPAGARGLPAPGPAAGPNRWRIETAPVESVSDWNRSSHWSVPWSDLMMVMFVVFAVLVTAQMRANAELSRQLEQREAPARPHLGQDDPPRLQVNVFERSRQLVEESRIDHVEIALLGDQSVKVSVQGPMFFELGRARLRPEVMRFLDRLGEVIRQTPYAVEIIGHTDDHPVDTRVFPSNWELSAARAARVARYLIDRAGVEPQRLTIMGRGEFEPSVPNDSDSHRARNRRVEIIITRDAFARAES